jgi:hypothetical protein
VHLKKKHYLRTPPCLRCDKYEAQIALRKLRECKMQIISNLVNPFAVFGYAGSSGLRFFYI